MNDHDQLREQMWDLVYDLVTPEQKAALEGRIKSDPKVARLYAEVSLEADLISQAAKVADTSVTLPQVEPRREKVKAGRAKETAAPGRGARISRSLHWLAAVAASALAVVLTVGTLWRAEDARREQEPVVVWVRQDESEKLVAYLPATFQIETKDPSGSPAPVSLWARVADAAGKPLYEKQVQTDSDGKAEFSVPGPAVEVGAKLQIVRDLQQQIESLPSRTSERAEDVADVQKPEEVLVDAPLPVEQEPIQAPTLFNQDQYFPGEDARFRVVPQTVISRKTPDVSALAFRLHAPDGRVLAPAEAAPLDGTGVVTGRFRLPEDAPPGRYLLRLEGGSRDKADEVASILVTGSAERAKSSLSAPHALAPGLATENGARLRGGAGLRSAEAPGGFGGGEFEGREGSRDRPMKLAQGKEPKGEGAGLGGAARSAKTLPAPAAPAPTSPVEDATVALKSANELRKEKEKLEQAQQIVDAKQLAQVEGDVKPLAGVLDVSVPPEFAGKPVKIEAYFKQVLLGEQLVPAVEDESRSNQSPPALDGRQSRMAALPLAPWLDGEKVDLLFRDPSAPSSQPLAQRVEIPSLLYVALADAKESYAPGEKVRLQVEVRKKLDGLSVPKAALGVVLKPAATDADEALLKLAEASENRLSDDNADKARLDRMNEEDRRADMSRRKMAVAPVPAREGAVENKDVAKKDALAAAGAQAAPAPAASDGVAAPREPAARPTAEPENLTVQSGMERHAVEAAPAETATEYFSPLSPVVISNEVSVKKALQEEETARAARQSQVALWRARLGRWLLALGVVMLVALGLAFALQRPAGRMVWIPSLGIVVASFAFGMMWIMQQPRHPGNEMAKAGPTPAEVRAGDNAPVSSPPLSDQSDFALGMDHDDRGGGLFANSYGHAAAPNDTDGGRRFGAGPVGGAAAGKPAEVRQHEEFARQPADRLVEGLDSLQAKSETRSAAKGADAPRENLPGTSSNSPAPQAAAKENPARPPVGRLLDLEEGEKKASGDASGTSGKLGDARSEGKSLSQIDKVTQMLLKRMDDMSKDGAARGTVLSDDRKKELLELLDEKLGKRAAAQGVWQPLLEADENGRAVIEFTMPQQPGEYRLVLDVSGLGHVGQLETKLRCEVQPAAPAASQESKP